MAGSRKTPGPEDPGTSGPQGAPAPWLNYHHLLYFWTAAREGSVTRAAARLRLAQPTISAQIHRLESTLDQQLFQRQGRSLVLTETGRLVLEYADEIFGIGRELMETLRGRPAGRPPHLAVGVANAVPKLIVYRLLRPAMRGPAPVRLSCREDNPELLASALASHALDVLISDTPAPTHLRVKVFNHLLGESETAFFAPAALARRLRRGFPRALHGEPMLLPGAHTAVRRRLDDWFDAVGVRPVVAGEFDDTALMKVFGQGAGLTFPAPAAISRDICRFHAVRAIGQTDAVRERYYAITAERRLTHPAVVAITSAARGELFA